MDKDNRPLLLRVASGIWRGLDRLRRLLHLILLLGFFLLLLVSSVGERVYIPRTAALVIAPRGVLVDQLSGDALDRALARAQGTPLRETLVRDVMSRPAATVNLGDTVRLHRRKAVVTHVTNSGAGLMMQGRSQVRPA